MHCHRDSVYSDIASYLASTWHTFLDIILAIVLGSDTALVQYSPATGFLPSASSFSYAAGKESNF